MLDAPWFLISLALLPAIFLMQRIYRMDRIEKEPIRLLLKLFLFGALSVIPTLIGEIALANWLPTVFDSLNVEHNNLTVTIYLLIDNFICVAMVEEGFKYLFLRLGSWKSKEFNYTFDAIVYATIVSLGFAAVENIFYVLEYGFMNGITRALTAVPGHCIFGIYMGVFYGSAKFFQRHGHKTKSTVCSICAVLVPLLLHGFYDYSLSIQGDIASYIFLAYLILLDYFSLKRIRRQALEDEEIVPEEIPHDPLI